MKQVNATLIRHACAEMKTFYYERDEDSIFRDNMIRMKVILDGPNKSPPEEKQKIKEVLAMYGLERLWEEDPKVQQTFAAGKAEGKAEGVAEGKIEGQIEGLRSSVEVATNARFPSLTELAHQKAASIKQAETLSMLLQQIITAPNEETVLWLLRPQKPS